MEKLPLIYDAIANDGFNENTILRINNYINDIQNGTENFP